ncbi:MAG: hypothetical protein Q9187_007398 [Circinaria calcarea]
MDGLSTAASAIAVVSLAGQLVSGVRALYVFWGSIQDAPGDIQAISTELKLLQVVVQDIHDVELRYGPDKTTMDILESCLSQINTLTTITRKLEGGLRNATSSGRKWGAFKAVLKGNKIKKFQDILRDTKITLVLVQQGDFRSVEPTTADTRALLLSAIVSQVLNRNTRAAKTLSRTGLIMWCTACLVLSAYRLKLVKLVEAVVKTLKIWTAMTSSAQPRSAYTLPGGLCSLD